MRIGGRDYTSDEAILTGEGSLMCMSAAALFAKPAWSQAKMFKGVSSSDPMTRLAGIALGAAGTHVLLAGRADGGAQRRAAKITAASSAVVSGLAIQQLAGSSSDQTTDKNKLISVAILGAANAVLMSRMAARNEGLI